jgi:hypothetical protein
MGPIPDIESGVEKDWSLIKPKGINSLTKGQSL